VDGQSGVEKTRANEKKKTRGVSGPIKGKTDK